MPKIQSLITLVHWLWKMNEMEETKNDSCSSGVFMDLGTVGGRVGMEANEVY